ncbi:MAG TPA: hypothetical protein VME22_22675 [Solirubrobacteraceae bacterium]|nr:hypothetical protein [Solirubrobacteraceae bacterium]
MSVGTGENVIPIPREGSRRPPVARSARPTSISRIRGGGTDGNEHLTTLTGMILLVQLAVIGVTIVDLHQLVWLHLFVGMLLLGPVLLKMSSVGYRFVRYYTGNPTYRRKGPPALILRLLGPMVLLSTLGVLATGGILLIVGPGHSYPWLLLHKATFIIWVGCMTLHVVGHLPGVAKTLGVVRDDAESRPAAAPGTMGRWIALTSAVVGGLILALLLIPEFSAWTATGVVHHHFHIG